MSERSIIKFENGKLVNTGKIRLPDGTIRVQPEGGIKFIPKAKGKGKKMGGANMMKKPVKAMMGKSMKTKKK